MTKEELDASIFAIRCEKCSAEPGFRCIKPDGTIASGFHGGT